ncbi:MAG: hypothetical protein ACTSX4_02610 [Candidatus Helarchaeota archaeon]
MESSNRIIENYKKFLFYLYLLGQIIRKKEILILESKLFEDLLLELKSDINNSVIALKKESALKVCPICDKEIGNKQFYTCDNCYSMFHKEHIKNKQPVIWCKNCHASLHVTRILGHEICLSDFKEIINRNKISRIKISF